MSIRDHGLRPGYRDLLPAPQAPLGRGWPEGGRLRWTGGSQAQALPGGVWASRLVYSGPTPGRENKSLSPRGRGGGEGAVNKVSFGWAWRHRPFSIVRDQWASRSRQAPWPTREMLVFP